LTSTSPNPHLEGYTFILKRLKIHDTQRVLYVGDRFDVELEPARRLGMQTVIVGSRAKALKADFAIDRVEDIFSIL